MFSPSDITEIAKVINKHYSMMICSSLGYEVLSDTDKLLLESYGVNIDELKQEFPPYMQMFLLGRLSSVLGEQKVKQLPMADFKKYLERGQFIPLSERERAEYEVSREMTYNHLKGLANKVTDHTKNLLLEENKKQIISEVLTDAVQNRKSISSIVSDLGHKTGEWDRDWKRIAVTEMQNIYNQGRANTIKSKYGEEALVWKQVFPLACRHCIKLYTTAGVGSEPIVFKLKDLIANGNNIGRITADWKPIVGATHPHCRCDIRTVFKGQVWDKNTGSWKYSNDSERVHIRTSKVKVTVGDKEFFI
jgi:hypothetical protein